MLRRSNLQESNVFIRRLSKAHVIQALLLAVVVLGLIVGAPTFAEETQPWDESYFVIEQGSIIKGLSSTGLTRVEGDKELKIGEGITRIGDHAFQSLGLTQVILPTSLESIGQYAFTDNAITEINLEDTQVTLPATCIEVQAMR